ncbi:MAG: tyrosine-type recombinase/integrase [Deltaproteobacteria bacterium]|nr:tyrosine-type recombinase/integrase [Deltaproteobacteria bacterium]
MCGFKEKNSIPLEIIQKILGHSDIRITQIYAQVYDDVIQKEMSKLKY